MRVHCQVPVSFQDVKVKSQTQPKHFFFFFAPVKEFLTVLSVQDEIFDMVKPKDPYKITLQDLVNSCQGDTVTSILIDLNGFWTYENREAPVANDSDSTSTANNDDS